MTLIHRFAIILALLTVAFSVMACGGTEDVAAPTGQLPKQRMSTPQSDDVLTPDTTSGVAVAAPTIPATVAALPTLRATRTTTPEPPSATDPTSEPLVPTVGATASETKRIIWTISDGLVALVDVPEDWEEDAELNAAYAGRKDVDALFLWVPPSADDPPAMSIYRIAKMDDAQIEARVADFLAPSDERKDAHTRDGEVGGGAAVIMTSVAISEEYGNERVARAYVQMEGDHTWMIICYASELDINQHADCDAALASVRIAPASFVRALTTPTPTATELATAADLAARYTTAGERLYEERTPDVAWEDGSNWQDGVSHQLPELPLAMDTDITEGMTCAQWEALEIAVFPEGEDYDRTDWWTHPDSDEIGTRWKENLARTIWGDSEASINQMVWENFMDSCGSQMR